MAAHTPGPWVWHMPDSPAVNPARAAFVYGPSRRCMDISVGFGLEDARLIAAAPDLLEALEGVCDMLKALGRDSGGAYEQARSAIAKATGGTD